MQTIGEMILKNELSGAKVRLVKLQEMGAPKGIVAKVAEMVAEMELGSIKIGGDKGLLEIEVETFEQKKGRGGKPFVSFNGGAINYFPQAQYGRFISAGK